MTGPWVGAFHGWSGWRWSRTGGRLRGRASADVLIGTDPHGREWSIGELAGRTARLVHPVEGGGKGHGLTLIRAVQRPEEVHRLRGWLIRATLALDPSEVRP